MSALERKDLLHSFRWKIVCFHPAAVEDGPFVRREAQQFGFPDRQRHHETAGQTTQQLQKPPLAKVDEARCIVDDDASHRSRGPRISRSTVASGSRRS